MRTERIVFFGDFNVPTPQRRSSPHTHTLTLTNTLTLTYTRTHWPTVASRSSGSRGVFTGFAKFFGPASGQQGFFWTARGSHNLRKYYPQRVNCFFYLCLYFCAGIWIGFNLPCKDSLLEINRVGHPFFSKERSVLCILLRSL